MMEPDPTPLDYRSPQMAPPRRVFSASAFLASAAVASVLLLDLLFVVPRFEAMFKDFGTKLPAVTAMLLSASRWMAPWPWVVFAVMPVAIGFLAAPLELGERGAEAPHEWRRRRRRRMRWTFRLMTIAIVAILLVTVVALFMPMMSLIQAVSGK